MSDSTAYKEGIHRYIFGFYYNQFSEKKVPDERPWVRVKKSLKKEENCRCEVTFDGICMCGSPFKYPYAEKDLIKQLENQKPPTISIAREEFEPSIKKSLRWDRLVPMQNGGIWQPAVSGVKKFGKGKISELMLIYQRPPLTTKALYAEHEEPPQTLAVIVHGHSTTMQKTMGLDSPDYMNAIGGYLFDQGFDVITFGTTGNMGDSSVLNRLLRFYKITLYGLWTKSICDTVSALKEKYKRIFVYGLSNGGTIADLLSVTCKSFDIVIVGDAFIDWGTNIWKDQKINGEYFLYWIHPFVSQITIYDLMKNSKSKKYYTTSIEKYRSLDKIIGFNDIELSANNKINVIFKSRVEHTPEISILGDLLDGKMANLNGVGINID